MFPIIILSGGLATRLRPITEKIPKSLIDINGQPFIFHQLNLLQKRGFKRVHYCLGFLGEMIEEVITKSDFINKIEITFSYDGEKLLGTGGTVKKIINTLPENFFITYGDSYLDIDYFTMQKEFIKLNVNSFKNGIMAIYKNDNNFDQSNVIFNKNRFLYSKNIISSEMNYIDYGVSILNKSHFLENENQEIFDLSLIYEKLVIDCRLNPYEVYNRFYEIGSLKGIDEIKNFLN